MAYFEKLCSQVVDNDGVTLIKRVHVFCTCARCTRTEPVQCIWCGELVLGLAFSRLAREQHTDGSVEADDVVGLEPRGVEGGGALDLEPDLGLRGATTTDPDVEGDA